MVESKDTHGAVCSTRIGRRARPLRLAALLPTALGAAAISCLFLLAAVVLFAVALLGAGCAFTQQVVKRTILSSPEMRFEELDPHRDLQDITGLAAGGGGGGSGGC